MLLKSERMQVTFYSHDERERATQYQRIYPDTRIDFVHCSANQIRRERERTRFLLVESLSPPKATACLHVHIMHVGESEEMKNPRIFEVPLQQSNNVLNLVQLSLNLNALTNADSHSCDTHSCLIQKCARFTQRLNDIRTPVMHCRPKSFFFNAL